MLVSVQLCVTTPAALLSGHCDSIGFRGNLLLVLTHLAGKTLVADQGFFPSKTSTPEPFVMILLSMFQEEALGRLLESSSEVSSA